MTTRDLKSFKILSQNKILDYRLGETLDLDEVKSFFEKDYNVEKIWLGPRHALGILVKNKTRYFLKLATSEGISVVTQRESEWNDYFNKYIDNNSIVKVPKNYDSGFYKEKYLYLITEYFQGDLLCTLNSSKEESDNLNNFIIPVINLSEEIQKLPQVKNAEDFRGEFISKAENWFGDIPQDIKEKFQIKDLLRIVREGVSLLSKKPRHGDLAPWHIIRLEGGKLGLIDGEHFLYNGVESYDICYFIQRVFSVLKNEQVALRLYDQLLGLDYDARKFKVVLAARAIGGFLDESLSARPDFKKANEFSRWVIETGF